MEEDEISWIFVSNLPWVDKSRRCAFCQGMLAYCEQFKKYREQSMNYEDKTDYQTDVFHILELNPEECWVYSPQFNKIMALMLGVLFKTEIILVGVISPTCINQHCSFQDKKINRWVMVINFHERKPDQLRISMRFPRKVTATVTTTLIREDGIYDPKYTGMILVADARLNWWVLICSYVQCSRLCEAEVAPGVESWSVWREGESTACGDLGWGGFSVGCSLLLLFVQEGWMEVLASRGFQFWGVGIAFSDWNNVGFYAHTMKCLCWNNHNEVRLNVTSITLNTCVRKTSSATLRIKLYTRPSKNNFRFQVTHVHSSTHLHSSKRI